MTVAASPAAEAAARRRTFAIISHPDAGKTTLTEKLLLFGGAIQLAGEVKAKGERRRARSDWMKIEQQRGISVTTSVMTFEYGGCTFNLLDTPGHEDFSEDTYRTLTAVDSAVMVLDAAKGIEPQTLQAVRGLPPARHADHDLHQQDGPRGARPVRAAGRDRTTSWRSTPRPMNWPIGMGQNFHGVFDLRQPRLRAAGRGQRAANSEDVVAGRGNSLADPRAGRASWPSCASSWSWSRARCRPFDSQSYREGHLTPVFFGSALNNFGVRELLDGLAALRARRRGRSRPSRAHRRARRGQGHRLRVQGPGQHGPQAPRPRRLRAPVLGPLPARHEAATWSAHGKPIAVANPIFFFARERELAEEAWPGDIIGVPNHGQLRVGDALTEGEPLRFTGIPNFAPEILMRVRLGDPMRAKHLGRRSRTWPRRASRRCSGPSSAPSGSSASSASCSSTCCRPGSTPSTTCRSTSRPPPTSPPAGATPTTRAELDRFRRGQAREPRHRPRRQPGLPRPQQLGPRPRAGGLPEDPLHRDPRASLSGNGRCPCCRKNR